MLWQWNETPPSSYSLSAPSPSHDCAVQTLEPSCTMSDFWVGLICFHFYKMLILAMHYADTALFFTSFWNWKMLVSATATSASGCHGNGPHDASPSFSFTLCWWYKFSVIFHEIVILFMNIAQGFVNIICFFKKIFFYILSNFSDVALQLCKQYLKHSGVTLTVTLPDLCRLLYSVAEQLYSIHTNHRYKKCFF